MARPRPLRLTRPTRMTLTDLTAAASPPSTRTELEHCGWEGLTDCTGTTGKVERSLGIRKARACRAALFGAFWKIGLAGFGSALRRAYPGSILRRKPLGITTCPTACRAMSSVTVVIKTQMGRCSWAAAMGRSEEHTSE